MSEMTKADVDALLDGTTPGPWGYIARPNGTIVVLTRDEHGNPSRHIAEMSWADVEGGLPDAHLIAAAPDLARWGLAQQARAEEAEAALAAFAERAEEIAGDRDIPASWLKAKAIHDLPSDTGRQALAAAQAREKGLRRALNEINALDPEHMIDGCAHTALRGLVLRMGEIARAALASAPAPEGGKP